MQLDQMQGEIERMRIQVHRQRGEIRQLQRAGISTVSAKALLERMLNKIDELCTERDRLKKEQGSPSEGRLGTGWGTGRRPRHLSPLSRAGLSPERTGNQ